MRPTQRAVLVLAAIGLTPVLRAESPAIHDVGIFSDLADSARITLPPALDRDATRVRLDEVHRLAVLYVGDVALKVYALAQPLPAGPLSPDSLLVHVGTADAAELRA